MAKKDKKDKKKDKDGTEKDDVKIGDELKIGKDDADDDDDDDDSETGTDETKGNEPGIDEDDMTEEAKSVKMVWMHKKAKPGTVADVFAFRGTANEEGYFVVDVPKAKVKNELKRKPSLIPLDMYLKRREMEIELENL